MTRIRKGIYRVGRRLWPTPLPLADVEETLREAVRRYEPPKYEGRIVYFQGDGDSFRDPGPFWRDAVGGSVEVRLIPGSGITIFHEPNVQVLARELADCLEVVPKGVPGG
jgi:hypothetical protein